jgi:hypothetical protein
MSSPAARTGVAITGIKPAVRINAISRLRSFFMEGILS